MWAAAADTTELGPLTLHHQSERRHPRLSTTVTINSTNGMPRTPVTSWSIVHDPWMMCIYRTMTRASVCKLWPRHSMERVLIRHDGQGNQQPCTKSVFVPTSRGCPPACNELLQVPTRSKGARAVLAWRMGLKRHRGMCTYDGARKLGYSTLLLCNTRSYDRLCPV